VTARIPLGPLPNVPFAFRAFVDLVERLASPIKIVEEYLENQMIAHFVS